MSFHLLYFTYKHTNKISIKFVLVCFLFLLLPGFYSIVLSQKLLPDTVYIDFKPDSLIRNNSFAIEEVIDRRSEDPRFVSFTTKKRYLLIPVDQEIYTIKPLANEIIGNIPRKCETCNSYKLFIDKFVIEEQKGRIGKSKYLIADIPVYLETDDSLVYQGTLFYNYRYLPMKKKETLKESTENLLSKWHTDFNLNIMTLRIDDEQYLEDNNFLKDKAVKSLYLNSNVTFFSGYKWWGFQGEIYFTRPETNRKNHYQGGIIRYQNYKDYDVFAVGRKAEHFYNRLNKKWVLDIDLNILMGFCRWKDIDDQNPKLYQVFDFELSSIQGLAYIPLNKSCFNARFGIIENLSYIIEDRVRFNIGLVAGIGYKF